MIIGIGTDILNIHNIENAVKNLNDPFVQKNLHKTGAGTDLKPSSPPQ